MKIKFINYRKETKGAYPIRGILPRFDKRWAGKIWHLQWRGYAVSIDFRDNPLADMADPSRLRKKKS